MYKKVDQRNSTRYDNNLSRSLIAQLVERRTVNPQVPGSSPGRGANLIWCKSGHSIENIYFYAATACANTD